MKKIMFLALFLLGLSACSSAPKSKDSLADKRLKADSAESGESSVEEMEALHRQEQQKQLERQITEPFVDSRQSGTS